MTPDRYQTPVGFTFHPAELRMFKAIYGAVALPGKGKGFAVVVGILRQSLREKDYDYILLDEYESENLRVLIRQCDILSRKYHPKYFIGNNKNLAVRQFIQEMDEENRSDFYLTFSHVLDMENPYEYLLPTLRQLLDPESKQLFLKDGLLSTRIHSADIQDDLVPEMQWGDCPAVEALGMAVKELRDGYHDEIPNERISDPWEYDPLDRYLRCGNEY